jgi:hypothetical protein
MESKRWESMVQEREMTLSMLSKSKMLDAYNTCIASAYL